MKKARHSILLVEDERHAREGLEKFLRTSYDLTVAEDGIRAVNILKRHNFDVVLTDIKMPGADGFQVLDACLGKEPKPSCIVISAHSTAEYGFEAKKRGADDFITKPVNLGYLDDTLCKVLTNRNIREENADLRKRLQEKNAIDAIVGKSAAMHEVMETARQVAPARTTVLISGESGTGKELIARALHSLSGRKGPFIAVHCAALPTSLLESELFGHEKGAFTGASEQRKGRFELSDGGTLFLDEIGEIDPTVQVKILRVLETKTFERVGGTEQVSTDVRVLAATNRDLKRLVEEGKFREDLFYRLFVVTISLPPLRARKEDIPLLVSSFVAEMASENKKKISSLSDSAMNALCEYDWPGNIRELRNCIERMVVLSRTDRLDIANVPIHIREKLGPAIGGKILAPTVMNMEKNEEMLILKALEESGGNVSKAAKILGISRRTLHRKINKFAITA